MIFNKFFLIQLLSFFVLFCLSLLSASVFSILWEKSSINYGLYFSISATYVIILIAFSRIRSIKIDMPIDFLFLGNTSKILLSFAYIFSICLMGYFGLGKTYLNQDLYIPFANIFILFILAFPFIFYDKKAIFISLILTSIVTLYLYETRIYIFFILILILVKVPKINIMNALMLIILLILLVIISATRAEINLSPSVEFTAASFFLNSFGAELRDGLFFYDIFTEQQLMLMREGFFYNWITFLPGWSYYGIIDGDTLRSMQIPAQLVAELGLDKDGFNGVRTGMLWESYILFGWVGVVTYSLISAITINLSLRLYNNGLVFLSGILAIANLYSIVGFSYFIISNFGQLIIFYLLFFRGLARFLRNTKQISSKKL